MTLCVPVVWSALAGSGAFLRSALSNPWAMGGMDGDDDPHREGQGLFAVFLCGNRPVSVRCTRKSAIQQPIKYRNNRKELQDKSGSGARPMESSRQAQQEKVGRRKGRWYDRAVLRQPCGPASCYCRSPECFTKPFVLASVSFSAACQDRRAWSWPIDRHRPGLRWRYGEFTGDVG